MTPLSARYILVDFFFSKKNMTSNGSKPIRVLTLIYSSRSDDHLPIGYSLLNFQLIWNNLQIAILQLQIALNPYEF